ncbi:SRPBCC family protein [Microbacterium oleivorans]|uniref:SRPBCC domain-containing protein n=1 Tax=Microbacterium oleivorans TaxID=273677 RepID=A0A7D5F539_9MICO|nr:SRPBCC family protein [Microbacterium oleivorans]QLD11787.1 SRPBCC domain-containing protein [Microbacterium oleivorans]
MPVTDITTDADNLTMTLVAEVDAPVERLWRAFTQPAQLERFWGPPGWPATFTRFEFEPGGRAQYAMSSPQGEKSRGTWEFIAIDEGRSFEVLDAFADEDGEPMAQFPAMRMIFSFETTPGGSRLTNITYFTSAEALEQVIAMGAIEGSRLAMGQLDAVVQDLRAYAQGVGTRIELLDDTHVRITRLIDGPRDLVWRAHHETELLKKWMLGPDGWSMTVAEPATQVGASFRQAWEQDGAPETAFGFEGELLQFDAPRRAVTTERMSGTEGPVTINDLQLYEEDGVTLLTLLIEYPDKQTRDMILDTGMAEGMETSYARLESAVLSG